MSDGTNTSSAATVSITVVQTVSAPTVTSLSPSSGLAGGGTSVVITGTSFTGATAVDFGSTAATTFSVNGAGTQITAVDTAGSGTVDVTVATSAGTSATSSADHFTYATVSSVKLNGDVAPIVDMSSDGSSTVLVTTDGNNGFTAGDTVVISEFTGANSGYNGTYTIITASGDTFNVHNANSATSAVAQQQHPGLRGFAEHFKRIDRFAAVDGGQRGLHVLGAGDRFDDGQLHADRRRVGDRPDDQRFGHGGHARFRA